MTILESMIAMIVLAIGVLGAASGIITASRQNSMAGRIGKAAAIASAVRAGLSVQGTARLIAIGGLLDPTNCNGAADVKALAGGLDAVVGRKVTNKAGSLQNVAVTPCVIDLDAWDDATLAEEDKIVPDYEEAGEDLDSRIFRRALVYFPDGNTPPQSLTMTVVVSWRELARRNFHRQNVNLYNASGLQMGVVDL